MSGQFGDLFPPVTWSGPRPVDGFSTESVAYPGPRAPGSFVLEHSRLHGLRADRDGRWSLRDTGQPVSLTGRTFVLAYGSNLDPEKLSGRLPDDMVVVLRCAVLDHGVVWCDARRRSGEVVATLAPMPGRVEVHGLLALTPAQLIEVDRWEGNPHYYTRTPFTGAVVLEDGSLPAPCYAYLGTAERRPPLLHEGELMLVSDHPYDVIDALVR